MLVIIIWLTSHIRIKTGPLPGEEWPNTGTATLIAKELTKGIDPLEVQACHYWNASLKHPRYADSSLHRHAKVRGPTPNRCRYQNVLLLYFQNQASLKEQLHYRHRLEVLLSCYRELPTGPLTDVAITSYGRQEASYLGSARSSGWICS